MNKRIEELSNLAHITADSTYTQAPDKIWLGEYSKFQNIVIAVNAPRMLRETRLFLQHMNGWKDSEDKE